LRLSYLHPDNIFNLVENRGQKQVGAQHLLMSIHRIGLFLAFLPFLIPEHFYIGLLGLGIFSSLLFIGGRRSVKYDRHLFVFLSLAFILILPSISLSNERHVAIPFAYFALPGVYWLLYYSAVGPAGFSIFQSTFRAAIIAGLISAFIQLFVSPDVFGLLRNNIYANELVDTTSFRLTGLLGSPQNASLLLSASLFLRLSERKLLNIALKTGVIIFGVSTLSLFFGVSLILFILSNLPKFLTVFIGVIIFLATPYLRYADFSNTRFEFLSFAEIFSFNERFIGWDDRGSSLANELFGNGPGTATQGMIDRGYVSGSLYGSESYLLASIHEFGFVAAGLIGILLLIRLICTLLDTGFGNRLKVFMDYY
jgi:hypothetical protein